MCPAGGSHRGQYHCGHAAHVLGRDARLPEEPGRQRQADRHDPRRGDGARRRARQAPTSSWSTRVRSSRKPGRNPSTRSSPWPTPVATGARLVVTGCMAERYGDELADALHDEGVLIGDDAVVGFGVPVTLGPRRGIHSRASTCCGCHARLRPRPGRTSRSPRAATATAGSAPSPPSAGPQRSRDIDDILREVDELGAREIVLVAQDLASFGRDQGQGDKRIVPLVRAVAERVDWVRLLYLYPSDLTDELIGAVLDTGVPYFDLSLQHVSRPLMRRMRRWGDGAALPRSHRGDPSSRRPTPPFGPTSSSATPARPRPTTTSCSRSSPTPDSTGAGSSRTPARTAPTPPPSTAAVPSVLVAERLAELRALQDAHHGRET